EHEDTARLEHSTRLGIRSRLLGKKHHTALANDRVERAVVEGQLHGIRLAPLDRSPGPDRTSAGYHRLIEVRGAYGPARGQCRRHRSRCDTGAGCNLEYARQGPARQPAREIHRVRLEDQGNEIRVVDLRNRTGE